MRLVGWWVGIAVFTRPLLIHAAAKVLPRPIVCILALIVLCGGVAVLLMVFAGIDPLTAYLATSPGGADSVAIIAASSNVDAAFVMSMQTSAFPRRPAGRPPALARFVAGAYRGRNQVVQGLIGERVLRSAIDRFRLGTAPSSAWVSMMVISPSLRVHAGGGAQARPVPCRMPTDG